jgi:hypothetical protein
MATSNTYVFTISRDTAIRQAMLEIGKLGDTESPTPTETSDCAIRLNMLLKQWQGRQDFAPGLKMWTRARGDIFMSSTKGIYTLSPTGDNWAAGVAIPLGVPAGNKNITNYNQAQLTAAVAINGTVLPVGSAAAAGFTIGDFVVTQLSSGDIGSNVVQSVNTGAGTVTLVSGLTAAANSGAYVWNYTTKGQPPLEIQSAILRDAQQNDTPLNYMTLQVYEALPTKVQPGYVSDPTSIYYEPQLDSNSLRSGVLYTDVAGAQDVTKLIHIVSLRPVQDINNPADTFDLPQEWALPVSLGLAKLICPMFNAIWTKEMEDNLNTALAIAKETTPETTQMYFMCHAEDDF